MRTYNVPRDVSGEDRILFIFSRKALIYTGIMAGVALPIHLILSSMNMQTAGLIVMGVSGLIGFIVGTFKVPGFGFKWSKVNAGENIDDIIKRAVLFKKKNNRIYIYKEGENK